MESTHHCQQCNQKMALGAVICPNCGAPAPGVYIFQPAQPPVPSAPSSSRRSGRFWLGIAGIIGGGLCSCLALVLGFLTLTGGLPGTPAVSQSNPSSQEAAPLQITEPPSEGPSLTLTSPTEVTAAVPVQSETPAEIPAAPPRQTETETPSTNPVGSNLTQFIDDFSNINGPWETVTIDTYTSGYFQHGNYAISLNVPQKMAIVLPPYPFAKPVKNIIVSVKTKGDGGNGFYGMLCHYQDHDNYYRASISGDQYAVDKIVNGQRTELTSPYWKKILDYHPNADGYITLSLACLDGRVQLVVDEVGQEMITTEDLDWGDVMLFAASGTQKNADGIYEQGFFDDFSAELPQP